MDEVHLTQYQCERCDFVLWNPIFAFQSSILGLYDDSRFPGRCLLVLRSHAEHFDEIEADTFDQLMREAQIVSRVMRFALNARRVNLAILGNSQSHVHAHIVPRFADDPNPGHTPWEDPRVKSPLPDADRLRIEQTLRASLARELRALSKREVQLQSRRGGQVVQRSKDMH